MFRCRQLPSRGRLRFATTVAAVIALLATGVAMVASPANAQNPSLDVRITTGPTNRTTGGLLTAVSVVNTGTEPLTNVQLVVRVPPLPAVLQNVTEASSPLVESINKAGVVDERTGFWYHTVVSIPVGGSAHFNVNWFNPCVGRWPFAARAGDRRTFVSFQFTGGTLPSCGADDVASPTPASWFELPWPPSVPSSTTTVASSPTSALPATTVSGATLLPTIAAPTIPGASTTVPAPAQLTTLAPPLSKPTTTKPKPTTTRRPATTLEIVCKTVGGRRYCGQKSSALKPGQAKPRAVPPTTKKKTKK